MSAQVVSLADHRASTKADDAAFSSALFARISALKVQIAELELHTAELRRVVAVFERLSADCTDIGDAEINALAEAIAGVPA